MDNANKTFNQIVEQENRSNLKNVYIGHEIRLYN
jgi:hypothetical protein